MGPSRDKQLFLDDPTSRDQTTAAKKERFIVCSRAFISLIPTQSQQDVLAVVNETMPLFENFPVESQSLRSRVCKYSETNPALLLNLILINELFLSVIYNKCKGHGLTPRGLDMKERDLL